MSSRTRTDHTCYNCFQPLEDPFGPCPQCGFDLADNREKFPTALQAGMVLNDRYIVGRVLGQGGFGITYLAFDTQLQAKVAIKEYMPGEIAARMEGAAVSVMADTRSEDFAYGAERFREEARTLAKFIGHPNVAGVSSYFDENGTSYFVMDYIEGISFKSYIANAGGRVSTDEALNVMIPVLRALTAVHAEGFIHRDVTPDNIYISRDGNVKLLDFGSARYSIGDKSKSLDVILKVGYAPKEQYIRRGRQGPYTDVYSCAACLYGALTGVLPPESLDRLEEDELVPVSQVLPDIPEWLDRAILKGLAVQPENRFQSAAEFLDAVENQIVVEAPGAAPAAQAPEKKGGRIFFIAAAVAVLAVCVGIGAFLGGRGRSTAYVPPEPQAGVQQHEEPPPVEQTPAPQPSAPVNTQYERPLHLTVPQTQEDINKLGEKTDLTDLSFYLKGAEGGAYYDLSPLSNLTDLNSLAISDGGYKWEPAYVQSLEPLGSLTGLKKLWINVSGFDDFSPLETLTELEDLSIIIGTDGTTPPDQGVLEPLRNMTNLRELRVYGYAASSDTRYSLDLSPLAELEKIKKAEFHHITADWSPVEHVPGLIKEDCD